MRGLLTHKRPARFRPVVEALKDRTVPTVIPIRAMALVVTGNNISIADTGDDSATNTKASSAARARTRWGWW